MEKEILSIKYHKLVKELTTSLNDLVDFSGVAVCILLKTGESAWLSSNQPATLALVKSGYYRGDIILDYQFCQKNRVIFPEEYIAKDDLQLDIKKICEQHQLYRTYCIVRTCPDCCILTTYNTKKPHAEKMQIYKATVNQLENFIIQFLNQTMQIYIEELPSLKKSRFATDPKYRENIIRLRHSIAIEINLSGSEIEVIYWSAQGKTAEEIAIILGLSESTVNTYRQRAIEKLQASNITHAVYLAQALGFIV